MKKVALLATAALLASTMAQAAVDVTVYRLQAGRYIRILWADTSAELPTTSVTEGAMAWDKATDTLLCWDSAAWVGCSSGGSGAPTAAEYIVAALHAGLSAERVGTDTTEVDWDFGTAGQAKLSLIDDSIEISRLKTSDTPADGECLVYESTGDEVAFNACGGGGGNSFETMNAPSGTDPVADSATDTLGLISGAAALSITGDSAADTITFDIAGTSSKCARFDSSGELVAASGDCASGDTSGGAMTLDLGDDGGNDSTALAEIAPINDNGGAFTEPSADKLQIDVAKLRPASADNPPETAPDWSCEFSASICSGTLAGEGSTSTPVSGTIDPTANVSGDPVYSTSFMSGALCFQSDESPGQGINIAWADTAPTDATYMAKFSFQNRNLSADPEGTIQLGLRNSSDTDEEVWANYYNAASGWLPRVYVVNAGATTQASGTALAENTASQPNIWLVLWKKSNVYWFGYMTAPVGVPSVLGSVTKTGTTSFDRIVLRFLTANETPSIVWCVDYVRQWDSLVYSFVNE